MSEDEGIGAWMIWKGGDRWWLHGALLGKRDWVSIGVRYSYIEVQIEHPKAVASL